jgi:rhodanese-related sulfurtransferase
MEQFIEFATAHWMLVSALVVLIGLLAMDGSAKAGPTVTPQGATMLINRQDAVVLDIRDKKDFKTGHLLDAINIPQSSLATRIGELEKYKTKPVIVVCKTGQTASAASKILKTEGYDQVFRLSGGMMEWSNQNLPLVGK